MNNILELKGNRFTQESKTATGGGASMNSDSIITTEFIERLKKQLQEIQSFWKLETRPFSGLLISVYYNKIAAKSNRIGGIFKGKDSNFSVVGAKFTNDQSKHIITYLLENIDLDKSISLLTKVTKVLNDEFNKEISKDIFDNKTKISSIDFNEYGLSKSLFKQVIADVSYIEKFEIDYPTTELKQSIITLYDTGEDTKELLSNLGIDLLSSRILDNQTVFLDENQLELLLEKSPYLVAMATEDLSELSPGDFIIEEERDTFYIPSPGIEPTIGVIDTLFDDRVYFSEWVEYFDKVDKALPRSSNDSRHGTAVSSIIVDGPRLNPWLDDGCGRFKVRHFGVAVGSQFSSFTITKLIKEIVANNKDIKVWNISLGSNQEINDNFISAEASVLDKIQYENDVIFVIAGTNKPTADIEKIGSPADSINGVVVNSVTKSGLSPKYARKGLALSFFAKPDVSYYGGSEEEYMRVCEPLGEARVAGTSFAAPWIARKLSYLIDILGLNREIAKALIIDSARGWDEKPTSSEIALYGHGIVPIRIEDIVNSANDEIKFLVSDVSEKWNTYNYNFPVPIDQDNKYPYAARATMCYFPTCDRTQGVDYTNTELDLHFGRLKVNSKDKVEIKEIDNNKQNQDQGTSYIYETVARSKFRKWDNVKYKSEKVSGRKQPKKRYSKDAWGMEVKTNNRLDPNDGIGIRFGVVVTLKEINGVNRIDEFIKNCQLNGWLVNQVDVQTRIGINELVNETIEFE